MKNPTISFMKIYFNDIALKAKQYKKQVINLVTQTISSGIFLNGQQNQTLEQNLNSFLGGGDVMTVASCHDAIVLSLLSLKLSKDDEVIFPVNAYPTAFPVFLSGAKPVPCDVGKDGQIDPKQLAKKITKKTKVVIVVHLYGLVGDLDKIKDLLKGKKIYLVEDCAQAFGATYKGKPVGVWSDISCFSFYPTKNLGTLGDGGAIWTKHKNLFNFFLKAKSYGEGKKYESLFPSGHSRLPEIQAGILNLFLKDIKNYLIKRKEVGKYYAKKIKETGLSIYMRTFQSHLDSQPVYNLFVVEAKNRNQLQAYLKNKGVETQIHYPYPIHLIPAFSFLGGKPGDFPTAERLAKNILSLPFHPYMKQKEINFILQLIKDFYA